MNRRATETPAQAEAEPIDLRQVCVRCTLDGVKRRRWDRLMSNHRYLPYFGLFSESIRHVAYWQKQWMVLIDWQDGAFKPGARDRRIGWSTEQQSERLHLIANNVRFLILPGWNRPNLASRVLSLSLRRISADMLAVHVYPGYLTKTFVDPSLYSGACYRASNWQSLVLTRGYQRVPGNSASYRHHGQPEEIFMFDVSKDARRLMCAEQVSSSRECILPRTIVGRGLCQPVCRVQSDALTTEAAMVGVIHWPVSWRLPRLPEWPGYRGVTAFAEFSVFIETLNSSLKSLQFQASRRRPRKPIESTSVLQFSLDSSK